MYRFFWISITLFTLLVACQRQAILKPIRPTATPGSDVVGQPMQVTFPELEEDPQAFLNQVIRVTGSYTRLPGVACLHSRGPAVRWFLVADNFRMDTIGFETILRLAPDGIPLTVDGIWRRYEGPLGCGKKPPSNVAWYLEVTRIVQPNPLPEFAAVPGIPDSDGLSPPEPPLESTPEEIEDDTTATPSPSPSATSSPTTTRTPTATTTGPTTPTLPALSSPTPTVTGTAAATSTVTPTPLPGTPTTTVTPSPTSPPATATPGGYPGPGPTEAPPPPGTAYP